MTPSRAIQNPDRGLTRLEVLVMIATLGLLLVVVVLGNRQNLPRAKAVQCLDNFHRLAAAILLYARDNSDWFPPNSGGSLITPGYQWCAGDVQGCPDMTNPDLLKDPNTCLITRYLIGGVRAFRCPTDPRYDLYCGADPAQRGRLIPAVRSVSMNGGVGTIDASSAVGGPHAGKPTQKVNGPWLDGAYGQKADSPYATFGKLSDFGRVAPAHIFELADESPGTINDAYLAVCAGQAEIVDAPTVAHQNGGAFSFCDGHVEIHRWKSDLLKGVTGPVSAGNPGTPTYDDWYWLASHATVNLKTGAVP